METWNGSVQTITLDEAAEPRETITVQLRVRNVGDYWYTLDADSLIVVKRVAYYPPIYQVDSALHLDSLPRPGAAWVEVLVWTSKLEDAGDLDAMTVGGPGEPPSGLGRT